MKKWIVALMVACVLLVSNETTSFAAGVPPTFNPPQHYYLALGDSLAFGYQAATFNQNFPAEPPTAFSTGYVDDFARMLQDVRPHLQSINFECTGETTVTFIQGDCIYTALGFRLHNSYVGSQLLAALAFLHQHPGQVSPITLNLGGDDLNALGTQCGSDVSCYEQQAPIVLAQIASNLNQILDMLRQAAPGSEIITMTSYSVSFLVDPRFLQLAEAFNEVITTTAAAHRVRVADVFTPFNEGPQPATICRLTLVCTSLQDGHPSDAGYQVIAQQLWAASGYGVSSPNTIRKTS
jgi:lysophospholipase L1-like esterase